MALNSRQSTDIRRTLSRLVPPGWLEETARAVGFIRRSRKVDAMALFWTLVLGFGTGRRRSVAGLRRCYQFQTGETLVPSAFYDRFTPALVRLLRAVLGRVLEQGREPSRALRGKLASFKDLVLADATVLRLHRMLEKVYPACRTNHTRAAVKVHAVMSVLGAGPHTVKVTSERVHENRKLQVGPWVKGRLLLFDLGYYSFRLFDRIDTCGGFFISRLKDNANPVIVRLLRVVRGNAIDLEGRPLQEVLPRLKRGVLDAEVEVRFRRRGYAGHRSAATAILRLVAVRDDETGRYHIYLTNVPPDVLDAEDVARTYSARWEVEILFRQLKSQFRIDELPSRKAAVVEALIYAAILTLVVSRTLMIRMRRCLHRVADRIPDERWACLFASLAPWILAQLLGGRRSAARRWRDLLAVMVKEMVDPNLARAGGLLGRVEGCA